MTGPPEDEDDIDGTNGDDVQGAGCWSASLSGRETSIGTFSPGATPPTITFEMGVDRQLNDASDPTITFRYYVLAKVAVAEDLDAKVRAAPAIVSEVGSKRLTLDIHRCVVTSDCP